MPTQRNLGDLYLERERSEWYWRALGTASASLVLLGFLVFPASFPNSDTLQSSQGTISIVSVILLALGYSLSVALWFICQSWLFQLDVLFIPCLFSCIFGAINVGINLATQSISSPEWSPAPISALALAVASTLIYAALCIFTWRRIRRARRRGLPGGGAPGRDTAGGERAGLIDHDDSQRKVWARLLSPRLGEVAASGANTYRIDIPDDVRLGSKTANTAATSTTLLEQVAATGGSGSSVTAAENGGLLARENHLDYGEAVPLTQLTPTAAALQQARERTLHNERSAARLNAHSPVSPAHQRAASPRSARSKEERYQGMVHRPAADGGVPGYGAGYGVVDEGQHPAYNQGGRSGGTSGYSSRDERSPYGGGGALATPVHYSDTLRANDDYSTAGDAPSLSLSVPLPDGGHDETPSFEVVNVPNFQVPLSSLRRAPGEATLTVGGVATRPDLPRSPRELEARMADGEGRGGKARRH